jgi:hypothetical protein
MSDDPSKSNSGEIPPAPISKTTPVTIGLVTAVAAAVFGFHLYLDARFDQIERTLLRIEDHNVDRWSHTSMVVWVAKFSRENPDLIVPPPVAVSPRRVD